MTVDSGRPTPKTEDAHYPYTRPPWFAPPPTAQNPSRAVVTACDGFVAIYDAPLSVETTANSFLIAAAPVLTNRGVGGVPPRRHRHPAHVPPNRATMIPAQRDCRALGWRPRPHHDAKRIVVARLSCPPRRLKSCGDVDEASSVQEHPSRPEHRLRRHAETTSGPLCLKAGCVGVRRGRWLKSYESPNHHGAGAGWAAPRRAHKKAHRGAG